MAEVELHGISPAYERCCRAVAAAPDVCALLDGLPPAQRQPNLLLGVVRLLGGPVGDPAAFLAFVREAWPGIAVELGRRRTQTNEPARCAVLLPVLAALPQPVALVEVGASAGLCLYPDRYRYIYSTATGDVRLGGGAVEIRCTVEGPVRLPAALPSVAWRAGIDLHPLDARSADDRDWLRALVWPEQRERLERLGTALAVAAADPPRIETGDLVDGLDRLLRDAPPGATVVVQHSAVLAYVPADRRRRFVELVTGLVRDRGVHWLANEAPGVVPGAADVPDTRGRFVLSHNGSPRAVTGPHGQSLRWLS
ncbi:DUF2332 domain-containing protein [Nakamurella endophytica]